MKPSLLVGLLALIGLAHAQLTPQERQGIEDTLFVGNMTVKDLQYQRRLFNDKYRLPLVNLAIDKPLEAADRLMAFHRSGAATSLAAVIKAARTFGTNDPVALNIVTAEHQVDPDLAKLPVTLRGPIKALVDSIADANAIIKKAIGQLSAEEQRYLIETLPLYANEDPSIPFTTTSRKSYDAAKILALIDKIDLISIRAAAEMLATSVERIRPQLEVAARQVRTKFDVKLRLHGLRVDVSGIGDDVHVDKDTALTVDLGGANVYKGRCAAGVGCASVLLDLGTGNKVFEMTDFNLGAGVLGVGLAYVTGGTITVRSHSVVLGCGLAGVGGFFHAGGNDSYQSVSLAQGYGEFGLGIFVDTAGNDRYDGGFNVQGAARTGGVGWLIDHSGDDVYKAGGLILNSPLFDKVHYSNGQGYASGYREDTGGTSGGIGLLTDLGGHDDYIGETYCQAASYWYSIGSLYDAGGNDTYTAYHYAQASAMHATAAYLFDLGGDDAYVCKLGACHACGHDYGVAFLLDRSGMDLYAAHDSRPAIGNANGLAIFVDAGGDDRYFGPEGVGLGGRGSGSLAVFCDLGGTDQYASGLSDGHAVARDTWGVAYDESGPSGGPQTSPPEPAGTAPQVGSLPCPPSVELEHIYAKATQWGVGTAQKEVQDNVAKLIQIGKPALQWMIDTHLATADRLQIRAFIPVARAVGDEGREMVAKKVASDNIEEARVALRICSDGGFKVGAKYLPVALRKPELQRSAAAAAGPLGSKESVDDLMPLTIGDDRATALAALVSLVQLADPRTVSTGEALLVNTELPMRKAAIALVGKFPDQALRIGRGLIGSSDDQTARTGVEILGNLGSPEALDAIGRLLHAPSPGLRIQALLALNGRVPEAYRPAVLDARSDSNPLVKAVAESIDLGR